MKYLAYSKVVCLETSLFTRYVVSIIVPEIGPESFGAFEKRTPGARFSRPPKLFEPEKPFVMFSSSSLYRKNYLSADHRRVWSSSLYRQN